MENSAHKKGVMRQHPPFMIMNTSYEVCKVEFGATNMEFNRINQKH
jgi:hypothetical protein